MRLSHRSRRRPGAVLVLTAFMMVASFALLAFAIDLGYLQIASAELQRTADSAAIASAYSLLVNSGVAGGSPSLATAQAVSAAGQYCALNKVTNQSPTLANTDVTIGYLQNPSDPTQALSTTFDPYRVNAVTVTVRRTSDMNGEIPLFFAPVLGLRSISSGAQATAAFLNSFSGFQAPSDGSNLMILPFALDQQTWNALLQGQGSDNWTWDSDGKTVLSGGDGVLEVNLFPQGTGSPGNRGTVNISASDGNSTSTLKRQIVSGITADDLARFGGKLQFNSDGVLPLNGDTGISAGVESSLLSIKGQTRVIPIFSSVSGPGNNATYTIVEFAGVRIMDVNLSGSMSSKRLIVQPAITTSKGGIPGGNQTSHYVFSPVWLVR